MDSEHCGGRKKNKKKRLPRLNMTACLLQGKAKGTPGGVKTSFSAWNPVGTDKLRPGTPTHALPNETPAFKASFT